MRLYVPLISTAVAAVACGGSGVHATAPRSQVPIKRVVLYQNGVGYFERHGTVRGNQLKLQARPSQINDLLKSLTVIDASKGRAVSISLPLEKTGAQKLLELPPQVRNASGLLGALRMFRGAKVTVSGITGSASGRVVGIEDLAAGSSGEHAHRDWRVTLKTDSGNLTVYRVADITTVSLRDRTLAVGLDQSLDVSLNEANWKPIELTVRLAGANRHKLVASYIVEMPRWKPAYRIVLGKTGKPLLQGWAVIDNVSGEDWDDVELSLVAGTPMSFVYDLHSPQFTKRVDLSPRGRTVALAPVTEQPGYRGTKDRLQKTYSKRRARRSGSASSGAPAAPDDDEELDARDEYGERERKPRDLDKLLEEQGEVNVGGAQVGSLYRYDIKDRVTVADRSSTLVAIINSRVEGQEVVYFRPELTRSAGESHPYRAVMFRNDTGFSLEKGPMAIYSHGTFVGEGFVERMEKGTTNFITYAIDGNVTLTKKVVNRDEGLRLIKVIDGVIHTESKQITRSVYKLKNRHSKPVTAYVRSLKRHGWEMPTRPEGTVENPKSLLIPRSIPSKGEVELVVEWVRPLRRTLAFDSTVSVNLLRTYLASGKATPAIKTKLQEIFAIKREMTEVEAEKRRVNEVHSRLSTDVHRVRGNLNTLRKTKGNEKLIRTLSAKLANLEIQLGKLSGEIVTLSENYAGLQAKLRVHIRSFSLGK